MADSKGANEQSDKKSIWASIGVIIVVLLAFGLLIAFLNPDDSGTIEEGTIADEDALDPETNRQYYTVERYVVFVKPLLSEEGRDNLNTVWKYIEDDPTVLYMDYYEHPEEIKAAYNAVKDELTESYGSGERTSTGVSKGDRYTAEGTLEKTDTVTPLGQLYKMVDINTNADLYFVFNADDVERINSTSMVGEVVQVEIEITSVDGSNVSYKVISGPTVVQE